jgi:citrate synthase
LSKQVKNSLSVTDNRTGKSYEFPITGEFIKASDVQKINVNDKVLRIYDPGYMNTINCTSKISFIDGDKGILEYRGYSI